MGSLTRMPDCKRKIHMCTQKKGEKNCHNWWHCLKPHSRCHVLQWKYGKKVQLLEAKHEVENDKLTTFLVMKAVIEFNHLQKCLYSSVTTTGNVPSHFPLFFKFYFFYSVVHPVSILTEWSYYLLCILKVALFVFITPVLFPISMTYILKCPNQINHFFLFYVITSTCCQLGCFPHLGFKYPAKGFCSSKPSKHYRNIKNDFGSGSCDSQQSITM